MSIFERTQSRGIQYHVEEIFRNLLDSSTILREDVREEFLNRFFSDYALLVFSPIVHFSSAHNDKEGSLILAYVFIMFFRVMLF